MKFLAYLGIIALVVVSSLYLPSKVKSLVVDNSVNMEDNSVKVVDSESNFQVIVQANPGLYVSNVEFNSGCGSVLGMWSMENLLQPQSQFGAEGACEGNLNLFHTANIIRINTRFDLTQSAFYPKLSTKYSITISDSVNTAYPKSLPLMTGVFNNYHDILFGLLSLVLFSLISGFYRQNIKPRLINDGHYFTKLTILRC